MAHNPKQDYYKDSKEYTGPRTEKGKYQDYVAVSSTEDKGPEAPPQVQRPEPGRREHMGRDWQKIINAEGKKFWPVYRQMPYKQRESIIRKVTDLGILKAIGEYEKLPKLKEMVEEKLSTL